MSILKFTIFIITIRRNLFFEKRLLLPMRHEIGRSNDNVLRVLSRLEGVGFQQGRKPTPSNLKNPAMSRHCERSEAISILNDTRI
jgi:hypothetical protein